MELTGLQQSCVDLVCSLHVTGSVAALFGVALVALLHDTSMHGQCSAEAEAGQGHAEGETE